MKTHILVATLIVAVMAGINATYAGESIEASGSKADAAPRPEIRLERVTPEYWRVTLDNPPYNILGLETIPQLNHVITQLETDPKVKVVVFQSAVPGFFLTHYDFVPPFSATTGELFRSLGVEAGHSAIRSQPGRSRALQLRMVNGFQLSGKVWRSIISFRRYI